MGKDDGDGIVFDYDMAIAVPFDQSRGAVSFDMWPLYRQLAQRPLLILRGEHSDLLSAATAQAMLEDAANARLVTIPGVGHAPELNEPQALAAIDGAFVAASADESLTIAQILEPLPEALVAARRVLLPKARSHPNGER